MSTNTKMTGRLIAAARALTSISQADFAAAAGLPVETLRLMEASGSARLDSEQDVEAVNRALDHFGVIIVEESDGMGAGVRLKFTRAPSLRPIHFACMTRTRSGQRSSVSSASSSSCA